MQKKKSHYFIMLLLHSLFILSCAQVSAPTGGKRDTTPPVIKRSVPANYSINFHQKEIKIEFDEWIQPLTNAKSQIIISPSIEPFPKIDVARNEMTIKLRDSLNSNTTYSIFFGDNIKDNHEGNIFPNYKYVFSTGSFIDSLKVSGNLKTPLDKIPDNTFLLLYKEKNDSAFLKKHPFYITKITSDGSFNLENVKEGDYRIYALSDKNGNYYYDLPTEAIGFTDSVFHIHTSLDTLNFILFMPEEEKFRVVDFDRTVKGGVMHITFNKELSFSKNEIIATILEDTSQEPIAFTDKEQVKITVYFPKLKADTASYTLILKDKGLIIDSLKIHTESKRYTKPVYFFNDTTAYKSLKVIETKPLKLASANYSLSVIDTSRMVITDTAKNKIPFSVTRDEDLQTYIFMGAWKGSMEYKLQLSDSALSDLSGNYSKKQEFSFTAIALKKTGNLLIKYNLPKKNETYIVLLKDNSGKVLDKQILRDSQAVKINYGLQFAGTYSVEIIDDSNGNGIWNSGNFITKTLPEKIYKESKPIVVKENWDSEETINADFSLKLPLPPTTLKTGNDFTVPDDAKEKENIFKNIPRK